MKNNIVESREYKVMLNQERFLGTGSDLISKSKDFWEVFSKAIAHVTKKTKGNLDKVTERRWITFYDTNKDFLRSNDYVFRSRTDLVEKTREVTLKFRHPDRFISQDRDMSAKKKDQGKSKFEEDMKALFKKPWISSLYSFSTKQPVDNKKSFETLKDIRKLYPDISDRISYYDDDVSVNVVNDFNAVELVIEGGGFKIGKNDDEKIECALVLWYEGTDNIKDNIKILEKADRPLVAEFSFKYKNGKGEYDGKLAKDAFEIFDTLQNGKSLSDWMNPESLTKTSYVYSQG